jgi:hypothetical protein
MTLIFYKRTPTACRPSTFLPALDHTAHKLSAVGHPRAGAKLHPGKEILTRLRSLRQHKTQTQVPTQTNNLQSLIPHMLSHPRKCAPSLLNSPSAAPLPFQGFNNRSDRKSQSPVACSLAPWEINSQQFSPLERMLTGLTTHFFNVLRA